MKTFHDSGGRLWEIAINVNAIKRCRDLAKVDLYGLVDDKFQGLNRLFADPVQFVDTLYVLCQEQAKAIGMSDEDFGRAMYGDAIGSAVTAFLEELTDFFPDPRRRAGMKKVVEKMKRVEGLLMDHMDAQLEMIDPDSEARKYIASSGISPGSSASTPGPSPSANST